MNDRDNPKLRQILQEAAELPPDRRSAFLDCACAGNAELRAEVESLLTALEGPDRLLDEPTIRPSRVRVTAESPSRASSVTRLGDFQILRELGRGGMGVVYEARQVSLNRKVALKVLANSLGLTPKAVIRFKREAEAAARLHHTNIVPIYATGEQDGCHYYAMELIEGAGLDCVIRRMRQLNEASPAAAKPPVDEQTVTVASADSDEWATTVMGYDAPAGQRSSTESTTLSSTGSQTEYFDTVARLFAEVADALDYAHGQGVVHRDVKPANLLLSPQGRLSINDFGLARMLEQPGMTLSGEFMGSPMYMSPEQITAGRTPLDHRTDIYSLGATMYEVLTLHTPFEGERRDQILAQILHKEPKRPRSINRKVPQDLETICLKAMEKDPDRRYQTAGKLAEDLRRYVSRFAISARRIGPVGKCIRWAKRSRAMAAALGGLLVAIVLGSFFASRAYNEHRARLKEEQEQALDQATAAALSGDEQQATQFIFDAEQKGASQGRVRMLYGLLAWRKQDYDRAVKELDQAHKLMPQDVAPIALLTMVYDDMADWGKLDEAIVSLEHVPPQTEEDFLFKGMAESNPDPEVAISLLNTAARMRNSGVVREAREQVLGLHASDTRRVEDVHSALADAAFAEAVLPGDPNTFATGALTRMRAAVVYEKAGEPDKQKLMMEGAGKLVEELGAARYRDSLQCHWCRFFYFDLSGDGEAAKKEYEEMVRLKYFDALIWEAQQLIRERNLAGAIALANDARMKSLRSSPSAVTMILAESDLIGARGLAQMAAARQSGGPNDLYAPAMLRALGDSAGAKKAFRALRGHKSRWPWRSGWYEKLLDFHCGDLTAQQLLESAGTSQFDQCEGNFHIGMGYLGDGNRDQARKHFQASVDTGIFWYVEYEWSRTFLARMQQDPNWPRWIPNSTTRPSEH